MNPKIYKEIGRDRPRVWRRGVDSNIELIEVKTNRCSGHKNENIAAHLNDPGSPSQPRQNAPLCMENGWLITPGLLNQCGQEGPV